MSSFSPLKPGEQAPRSGQYPIVSSTGRDTGVERTVVKGKPMPPTPRKGQAYGRPDLTRNKSGRGR
jgi:hypothetical protein